MKRRKGYIPVGETFVAEDGKTYVAVPDTPYAASVCRQCDLGNGHVLCYLYSCTSGGRDDGVGVHFKRVKDENQEY